MALFPVGAAADYGDAVPADYWKKLGELLNTTVFYNVRNPDFGAVGDGTTDDRAAIQACIDASPAGATILFPPGTYGVSAPVVRKVSRRYMGWGPGWADSTIIKPLNGSSANFQNAAGHSGVLVPESWNTNATTPAGVEEIHNLSVDGNKANNATGQHHGLIIYGEYWSKYRNLRLYNNKRTGLHMTLTAKNGSSTMPAGISDNRFRDIQAAANDEHGVFQSSPAAANHQDAVFDGDNLFYNNGLSGMWVDNGGGWNLNNLHMWGNGQHGLYFLDSSFAVKVNGLYVENFGNTAAGGVSYFGFRAKATNGEGPTLSDCHIRTLDPAGTSSFFCYALEGADTDVHLSLTNCQAVGAGTARGRGFNLNASSGVLTVTGAGNDAAGFVAGQDREYIGAGLIGTGAVGLGPPATTLAGTTYTLVASDADKAVELTSASPVTVTVPANVFKAGQVVEVTRMGTGSVTLAAGAGMTVRTPGTLVLRVQYSSGSLRFRSATECVLAGDTT
jgi:hypothetical protein